MLVESYGSEKQIQPAILYKLFYFVRGNLIFHRDWQPNKSHLNQFNGALYFSHSPGLIAHQAHAPDRPVHFTGTAPVYYRNPVYFATSRMFA